MKFILRAVFAATACFAAPSAFAAETAAPPAELNEAAKAFVERDYEAVLALSEKALANLSLTLESKTRFRILRARALSERGEMEKAIRELNDAADEDRTTSQPLTSLANLHVRAEKYADAIAAFRKAVAIEQNVRQAILANLEFAWFLATGPIESLRDGDLAVTRVTRARDLLEQRKAEVGNLFFGNQMATVLDVSAAAYAEQGDFKRAVAAAEAAAVIVEGGKGVVLVHAGLPERLALYKAGKTWHQAKK